MAFKITQNPKYKTTVTVFTPNNSDGFDKSTFKAEFKRVGMAELDKLRDQPQKDMLLEVLVGWDDLIDESGNAVEYTDANKAALFDIPQAVNALLEAFYGSLFKAKEKN